MQLVKNMVSFRLKLIWSSGFMLFLIVYSFLSIENVQFEDVFEVNIGAFWKVGSISKWLDLFDSFK